MPEHIDSTNAQAASKQECVVSRRTFLKSAAVAGGLSVLGDSALAVSRGTGPGASEAKKPNILFILTDQLNVDAIAYFSSHFQHEAYGAHWVKTPNLDRLAREGTSFMDSNSANPVCSPARSCLFTGRMAIETGVVRLAVGIDERLPNIGQWFEEHTDYRRIYCGKWHAGGHWDYPDVSGPRKIPGFDTLPVGGAHIGDGSHIGIYVDPQVSHSVASFIANDRDEQPYLMVASFMNPHDICFWTMELDGAATTPETDIFRLEDRLPILPPNHIYNFKEPNGESPYKKFHSDTQWRNYTYDYYRMVEDIDEHVGRIMDAVRQRNDDTVVIFTSDHGEGLGRHSKVEKWHPYESSIKVPFIIWNPKRVKSNNLDSEHMVNGVDVMPTVCSYAGIAIPPEQRGLDLRPIVDRDREGKSEWRDNLYSEWQITGRVIRTNEYKYAMKYVYSGDPEKPFVRKANGAHTQFVPGQGEEYAEYPNALLFDLKKDPWETVNLIDDPSHAEVVSKHRAFLRDWESRLIPGQHYDRN